LSSHSGLEPVCTVHIDLMYFFVFVRIAFVYLSVCAFLLMFHSESRSSYEHGCCSRLLVAFVDLPFRYICVCVGLCIFRRYGVKQLSGIVFIIIAWIGRLCLTES